MTTKTTTPTCIDDVMTRDPICVTPDATVRELATILYADELSGLPVVDGQDRLIGVVSKTDLLHECLDSSLRSDRSFFETLTNGFEDDEMTEIDLETRDVVENFMSTEPITASPEEAVSTVARRMSEAHVHRVIVTDEIGCVIGIVSSLDIVDVYARAASDARRNPNRRRQAATMMTDDFRRRMEAAWTTSPARSKAPRPPVASKPSRTGSKPTTASTWAMSGTNR